MTSLRRAQDFIRRGRAEWLVPQKKIRFLELAIRERDSDRNGNGVCYQWGISVSANGFVGLTARAARPYKPAR